MRSDLLDLGLDMSALGLDMPALGLDMPVRRFGLSTRRFGPRVVEIQSTNIDVVICDLDCRHGPVWQAKLICRGRLGFMWLGRDFLVFF